LFGTLDFPQGNITHALLRAGLGKSVAWSAQLTTSAKAIAECEQYVTPHG
jgi:hypothetical protein